MKRSSSDTVDEIPWTDVQQEPAKKPKPDNVCIAIEPVGVSEVENGHKNGGENGHHNGDSGESNGTQHEIRFSSLEESNPSLTEVENGAGDLLYTEVIETTTEAVEETDKVDWVEISDAGEDCEKNEENSQLDEDESMDLRVSEEKESESEGAAVSKSFVKLPPKEGTWEQRLISIHELPGHSFKINAVDMVGNILVSASDDTTVKAWNLETKAEICTFSGHKEPVTAVQILDLAASRELSEDGHVVISGSTDCYIKIWLAPSGKEIKSIYTYNPISCVAYIPSEALIVTGTKGGKLELFDAKTGKPLHSELPFDLPVVSMKVCGDMIICGDPQGRLQVWILRERKLIFKRTSNSMETSRLSLAGIDFYGSSNIIAGLLSGSIKKMSWTNGSVVKMRRGNKDRVDALQVVNELMVYTTSTKDKSYLHFYNLPSNIYLGSAEGHCQMTNVAAVRKDGHWHVATGGEKLQLWVYNGLDQQQKRDGMVEMFLQPQSESQVDESDSEEEEEEVVKDEKSNSWCSVM
ncbi:Hypothetical predicted protein [Cloeon dipterum]|uniref:Anaphase-promoting complex subunit 4 WD40 domain-containing protein n=1 Tax=Cloeon dipterum TaxID=197152 RepID=A0A8S1D751_9INSE|nr:Hypothetical predicted protein [Cloeon dipterum]